MLSIDSLRKQLLPKDILHVDETMVKILKEEGRQPQGKSHMWFYRTGKDDKAPIILFDYQPSRSGELLAAETGRAYYDRLFAIEDG